MAAPLEPWQPLSSSVLWALQRRFYAEAGPQAWSPNSPWSPSPSPAAAAAAASSTVPSFITSNSFIARAYAELVYEFVWQTSPPPPPPSQQPPRPRSFVVELGSGSGQFGFLLLLEWTSLCERRRVDPRSVCVVLTDVVPGNVAAMKAHPQFQQFLQRDLVRFAEADATSERSILALPIPPFSAVVFICNYLMDSLPHDMFSGSRQRLRQLFVQCSNADPLSPPSLASVKLALNWHDIAASNPSFDFPRQCVDNFCSDASPNLLFPSGTICTLNNVMRLCRRQASPLLVLLADKSVSSRARSATAPGVALSLAKHGSVSIPLNFQVVEIYARAAAASFFFRSSAKALALTTAAFAWGVDRTGSTRIEGAFDAYLSRFGVSDFFAIQRSLCQFIAESTLPNQDERVVATLQTILSCLRLSVFDAHVFHKLSPALVSLLERVVVLNDEDSSHSDLLLDALEVVLQVKQRLFHTGGSPDLWFVCGRACFAMEEYRDALALFQESEAAVGSHPNTSFNVGLAHLALGRMDLAAAALRKAVHLEPDHAAATRALNAMKNSVPRASPPRWSLE